MANNEILLKVRGLSDFSDIQDDVKSLQTYFSKLKLPKGIAKNLESSLEGLDKELLTFQKHMDSGFKTKGDITGLEKSGKKIIQTFEKIEKTIQGLDTDELKSMFSKEVTQISELEKRIKQLSASMSKQFSGNKKINIGTEAEKQIVGIQESLNQLYKTSETKKFKLLQNAFDKGDIKEIRSVIEELKGYEKTILKLDFDKKGEPIIGDKTKSNALDFYKALRQIESIVKTIGDNSQFKVQLDELGSLEQQAEQLGAALRSKVDAVFKEMSGTVSGLPADYQKLVNSILQTANAEHQLNSELGELKSSITHFFSLINAAQLLRRAFQDVYNTIKELDAVMTETAVVTDFSVGDMWDKLPEYTAQAKALGVATKELYAATTLYYQQGLDTNASMAAGIETMKMAKIAGMEAADATDAMTAALRGFNMEVNETNAQRVNDVYSKLAAITASDTEEIATAMSKTASIASAVGAEFENIAVFLAQGIETTRESADSIGTALKTVLARFNELTKDPAEIGEIDGEIVDANKVEKALRSVGIALTDTNGQFREADKVLLEVAQKWNTMSVMQQRYIATQAAGSRQQSRFIAMMSDYNRTMELQTAAYNAEGAAQAQYEKTLESLESKIAKLKDTWDEFILGIANSDVIKGAVDLLSDLLNAINKMTNAPGVLGGVLKSLLAFGVFKGGKALVGKGSIGERLFDATQIAKAAAKDGESASEAFRKAFASSKKSKKENLFSKLVGGASLKPSQDALEKLKMTETELTRVTEKLTEAQEEGTKTSSLYTVATNTNTTAGKLLAENLTSLQIVYGLTAEQAENAAQWIALGVPADQAAAAAAAGVAASEKLKKEAIEGATQETLDQIKANELKVVSEKQVEKMNKKRAASEKKTSSQNSVEQGFNVIIGNLNKFKNLKSEDITAKITEAFEKLKVTTKGLGKSIGGAAKGVAKGVGGILKSLGGIIVAHPAIAAAVAAIGLALSGLVVYQKYFSLDARLENAAESAKRTEEAVTNAKQAYEELLNVIEERKDAVESIDQLTEGTNEFKMAVMEANQEMLDLIELYPKLRKAGMTEINEKGVMKLTEEGEQYLTGLKLQQYKNAQSMSTIADISQNNIQKEEIGEKFETKVKDVYNKSLYGGKTGSNWETNITRAIVDVITLGMSEVYVKDSGDKAQDALVDKINKGEYNSKTLTELFAAQKQNEQGEYQYTEEFKALASEMGLTTKELISLENSVIELTEAIEEEDNQSKDKVKEQLKIQASDSLQDSEHFGKILDIYATSNQDKLSFTDRQIEKAQNNLNSKDTKKAWAKQLMDANVIEDIDLQGLSEEEMARKIYKAITGNEAGEMKLHDIEIELTKFKLAYDADIGADAMNTFYENLEEASDETKIKIETILNNDIDITADQLNGLFDESGELVTGALKELTEEYQKVYGDIGRGMISLQLQKDITQADDVSKTSSSAVTQLASDGKVEDEEQLIASLEQVEGLYGNLGTAADEWAAISQKGIVDQMSYLTALSQQQYQTKQESIDKAKEERAEILKIIETLENVSPDNPEFERAQGRIEELKKTLTTTDWVLDIEVTDNFDDITSSTQALVASFDKVVEAAELVGEGFVVSAEDAQELSDVYPGILKNATVSAEGQITLDQDIANSKIGTAEEAMKANAESQKAIVLTDQARLDAAIKAKEIELKVVEMALASEDKARQAQILSNLANQEGFVDEIAQLEQDEVETNLEALKAKGINTRTYGNYELDVGEDVVKKSAEFYQKDYEEHKDANDSKAKNLGEFLSGMVDALKKFLANDLEGAKAAFQNAFSSGDGYTADVPTPKEIEASINESDIKDKFNIVKNADGELDVTKTLEDYYNSGVAELEDMRVKSASLADQAKIIDASVKNAIYKMKNPGKDGKEDKSKKDKDFDYDEYFNQQQKLAKLQIEKNKLEKDYEKILKAEIVDLKKLEENQKKQLENLQQQRDIEEKLQNSRINRMNQLENENSNFAKALWYDDELGTLQINEDEMAKIANMSAEDIEAFEKYQEKMTEHNDAQLESRSDLLDIDGNILEITERGTSQLDKSFNTLEKIESSAKRIEEIEREITAILSSAIIDSEKLNEAYSDQVSELQKQKKLWEEIKEQREQQYENLKNSESGQQFFQKGFVLEIEPGTFEIDWDKLGIENQAIQDAVVNFVEKLNTASENVDKATDSVSDFDQKLRDAYEGHMDKRIQLIKDVRDLVKEGYQKEIDKLSDIDGSINETNEKLMNSISKSLSEQRQQRDNEKTEQDIADTEARLVYLKSDTTGANDLEIKNLEKTLQEKKEDYTDTLIDQKISELQQQNDEAAAQRQVQIELAQAQLDQYVASGKINEEVKEIINNGVDGNGIKSGSTLEKLLQNSADYTGMSSDEQEQYWNNKQQEAASYFQIEKGIPINVAFAAGTELKGNQVLTSIFKEALKGFGLTESQEKELLGKMNSVSVSANNAYNTLTGMGATDKQVKKIMEAWDILDKTTKELKTDLAGIGLTSDQISKIEGLIESGASPEEIKNTLASMGVDFSSEKGNKLLKGIGAVAEAQTNYKFAADDAGLSAWSTNVTKPLENWADSKSDLYKLLNDWGVGDKLKSMMDVFTALSSALTGYKFTVGKNGEVNITNPNGTETASINGMVWDSSAKTFKKEEGKEITVSRKSNYTPEVARAILKYSAKLINAKELQKVLSKHGLTWEASDINGDGKRTAYDARGALRLAEGMDQLSDPAFDVLTSALLNMDMDDKQVESLFKNAGVKYKTGGLADFTGPAWLDGTKSKPEMVLNAQDTQNFIQLKDILSQVLKGVGTVNTDGKTGDIYYEIHIDVDKMTSDYDVDDVANRVKTIIAQDATYRNNNVINNLR